MIFNGPEFLILAVWMLVAGAMFFLTIWSIIDIARNDFVKSDNKIIWLLICLMIAPIGSILYLTQRKKLLAKFSRPERFDRFDLDSKRPIRHERDRNSAYDEDQLV